MAKPANFALMIDMLGSYCTILLLAAAYNLAAVEGCGSTLPGIQGNLTHPEYPQDYGSNADCVWSTAARERDKVFFHFELLDIEEDRNGGCTYDYVSIQFDEDNEADKFCGLQSQREATDNLDKEGIGNPDIKFISDDSVQHKGFLINYRIERFNYCQSEPCQNDGTCVLDDQQDKGWRCDCVSGWAGEVCDEDKDECAEEPCQSGGTCSTPDFDMYSCVCALGFTGDDCEINIDECESDPCKNEASCVDDIASYSCECSSGYTGSQCETDIDECSSSPCENGGSCFDQQAAFHCRCMEGFEGNSCETNIDECKSGPCLNGGTCEDGINQYNCHCAPGYTGQRCEIEIEECASEPCQNGATCVEQVNGFQCICESGYSGDQCEIELDECDSQPCQNQAPCVDHPGLYECICPRGFVGINCETDPCESSPCQYSGSCIYTDDGYSCECVEGYTGRHCETDTNECMSRPCLNNGLCDEYIGYYVCNCQKGFTGEICESNIDDCAVLPCLNGGSCIDEVAGYKCMCRDGYNGSNCEDSSEADWHNQTHLLSAILPSILFLIIAGVLALLFFAYVRRRRTIDNRVRVVKVKPAADKTTKNGIGGGTKKNKANRQKKKRRFSGSIRYDIDSDVISVAENDYWQKMYRPTAFVGRMPDKHQNNVNSGSGETYRNYRTQMEHQPPALVGNVLANPQMIQTGMFQPFPHHLYGYPPNSLPVIPTQTNYMPHHTHCDNMVAYKKSNHYRKRSERKQLSFTSRQCHSPDTDEDNLSSTTESTISKKKTRKKIKNFEPASEHDTTESRVGSAGTSTQNDVDSTDNPIDQPNKKSTRPQDKQTHWQERDNKKLHNFPSQHRYFPTGSNLGPPASEPTQKQSNMNKSDCHQPTTDIHLIKPNHGETIKHHLNRERTFFNKLQRQKTSFKKSSMVNPGLRSKFHKKKMPKRKSLDSAMGLSPIREESSSNLPLFKPKNVYNSHSQEMREEEKCVRFERHPPEGGVGSDPESQRCEIKKNKKEISERRKTSKEKDNASFFKLIRSKKQMSINRGRGFTRENAFVQDI